MFHLPARRAAPRTERARQKKAKPTPTDERTAFYRYNGFNSFNQNGVDVVSCFIRTGMVAAGKRREVRSA